MTINFWIALNNETLTEGAGLEVADAGPCRFWQAKTWNKQAWDLEALAHRLRPEGVPLREAFSEESWITI
ncbi:MAG: hypothetical protein HY695_33020 [Deltaproteobacteria bacterium]|nr:hypothetical protein [Deltaproteobacteria bacterium]